MSNKIQKHSPIKIEPLRSAGQSGEEKINDILYVEIMTRIMFVFCIFGFAFKDWLDLYFKTPPQPLLWFVIGIIFILIFHKDFKKYWQEAKNTALGIRGEKKVGELLEKLRKDGYEVFHDLINEKGNIDHIIVGPAGVFIIETKTHRKSGGDERISFDGENILINGFRPDKAPIKQALGEKQWLQNHISKNLGDTINVKVTPIIIYPDWFIDSSCKKADVWIYNDNEKGIPARLKKMKTALTAEKIEIISSLIGNYIRKYEKK